MKFEFTLISKYRTSLMGIAIFDVMLGHFLQWTEISFSSGSLGYLIGSIISPASVEWFLLVSGLGLYYSYSNNPNIKAFYERRVQRLILPFMIMVIPFYSYLAFIQKDVSILTYVGWITTIGYWFGDTRFWYIALSVVLYASFPILYKLVVKGENKMWLRTMLVSVAVVVFSCVLSTFWSDYFDKIRLSIPKVPNFIIGIYLGYQAKNKKSINVMSYISLCFGCAVLFFLLSKVNDFMFTYVDMSKYLITVMAICLLLEKMQSLSKINYVLTICSWLGRYSLELYVLHTILKQIVFVEIDGSIYTKSVITILLSFLLCYPMSKIVNYLVTKFRIHY